MIEDIEKQIEEKRLTLKDVEGLLLEISWIEYPEIIRKLLAYKKSLQDCQTPTVKTDADIKAEWKTEKLPDGTLRLVSYKGMDTVVNIPEKIGKTIVSEIGAYALSVKKSPLKKELREGRARIKEVIIPGTIKIIGESAFEACEGLEKVTWTPALVTISQNAFKDCVKLASVDLHEGIKTIGEYAFSGCISLKQVIIPKGARLHEGIFCGCSKVRKIVLHDGLKKLPRFIFCRCSSLTDINLPDGLTTIGESAFYDCKKLSDLTIPETVKSIAGSKRYWHNASFEKCKKLVLKVKEGSYAEEYASKNDISYQVN